MAFLGGHDFLTSYHHTHSGLILSYTISPLLSSTHVSVQLLEEQYATYRSLATSIFGFNSLSPSLPHSVAADKIMSEPVSYVSSKGKRSELGSVSALEPPVTAALSVSCPLLINVVNSSTFYSVDCGPLRASSDCVSSWSKETLSRAIRSTIPADASDVEPRHFTPWLGESSGEASKGRGATRTLGSFLDRCVYWHSTVRNSYSSSFH